MLSILTAGPAWAADGPPVVEGATPQSGPTAGGIPVRIYGTGFQGTTSVKFGAVLATNVTVIDSGLMTVIAPPAAGGAAADNTAVGITVTDDQGTNTFASGFYYTNASLTVSPSTGVHPGDMVTVTLSGYKASTGLVAVEVNPLLVNVEDGPPFPGGPPPYADPLASPSTDASGNATFTVTLSNPFNTDGVTYDANAVCPTNQTTANFLGNSAPASFFRPAYSARCLIAVTQFGIGTLDTPISFTTDPVPAPPVLKLANPSTRAGDTVTIAPGSVNWNANPMFGSSPTFSRAGETRTEVMICGIGGNPAACSATAGTATVSPTRYVNQTFSGATLSGSIVVGNDVPRSCACFVRVRQYRPAGGFIEATAPLDHAPADFDGDLRSDIAVFRASSGGWFVRQSAGGDTGVVYGTNGDLPVPGDYDGDGRTDVAIFRPSTGLWSIHKSSGGPDTALTYGINGDVPVPGDYDGDGRTDIAVFRPSSGGWYYRRSSTGADVAVTFGVAGDIPVVGDYDGDARTDIAVFRPASGAWFVHGSSGVDMGLVYGASGDVPVPGDYDGDGRTDIAIFRSSAGLWSIHNSAGGPDTALTYGVNGDVPVPGDYDGDGRTDVGVFRPGFGLWYSRRSATGTDVAVTFGVTGDAPVILPSAIRARLF
jgi:hypothetical protein